MKKIVIQIVFVCVASLLTLYLSIYSIIDNYKKDKESACRQEELTNAQKEIIQLQNKYSRQLQQKSNEIIALQKKLQERSDVQIAKLAKLANPIPSSFSMNLSSTIHLSINEFRDILEIYNTTLPNVKTNFLPIEAKYTNAAFDKINALKDVYFSLQVIFKKDDKILRLRFKKEPLRYMGFNSNDISNVFVMALQSSTKSVSFSGLQIETTDIYTNYKEPSISDFKESKAFITCNFFYPEPRQTGNQIVKFYMASKPDYISLNIEDLTFSSQTQSIHIKKN